MTEPKGKRTTPTGRTLGSISALRLGDHLCIIYRTDEEHRTILTEYLQGGGGVRETESTPVVSTRRGLMGSARRRGSGSSPRWGDVPQEALLAPFVPGEGPPEGPTAGPTAARGSKKCYAGSLRRNREALGHGG